MEQNPKMIFQQTQNPGHLQFKVDGKVIGNVYFLLLPIIYAGIPYWWITDFLPTDHFLLVPNEYYGKQVLIDAFYIHKAEAENL